MSVLNIEGFDSMPTTTDYVAVAALLASMGFQNVGGSWVVVDGANTRGGIGKCLKSTVLAHLDVAFTDQSQVIFGMAFKYDQAGSILAFKYDDHNDHVPVHMLVATTATGCISVERDGDFYGDSGVTNQWVSPPNTVFTGVWHYIEFDIKLASDGTGWVKVRVDGVSAINVTNISNSRSKDLQANGSPWPAITNLIRIGQVNQVDSQNIQIDDMYLLDPTGTINTMLGDCVVHAVMPVSDLGGTDNDMVQTGGTAAGHFTSINEVGPDDDTSYLQSNTVGDREIFDIGAIPADIANVIAVGVVNRAKKTEAGAAKVHNVVKLGTNEAQSGDIAVLPTYNNRQSVFETKPGGGNWTLADVAAMQIGVETA